MKKNFLLLMMTLVAIAGWAEDLNITTSSELEAAANGSGSLETVTISFTLNSTDIANLKSMFSKRDIKMLDLTNASFPDNEIADEQFKVAPGQRKLVGITFPKNITSIGKEAFVNNGKLCNVVFPDDCILETIGDNAFNNCGTNDTSYDLVLPASLTSIGTRAFNESPYKSVSFKGTPSAAMTIKEGAFRNSVKIVSVSLPSNVTSIGSQAFGGNKGANNYAINSVTIAATTVPTIDANAFKNVAKEITAIEGITLTVPISAWADYKANNTWSALDLQNPIATTSEDITALASLSGKNYATTLYVNMTLSEADIANLRTFVCENTLNMLDLTNTVFPDNTIPKKAFMANPEDTNATKYLLKGIILPNTVTVIDDEAFRNQSGISSITFPADGALTTIGTGTKDTDMGPFANTGITSITIPKTVTRLGVNAFRYNLKLTDITFESGINLTELTTLSFSACSAVRSFTVPACVEIVGSVAIPDKVEQIVFEAGSKLRTLQNRAFFNMPNLQTLTLTSDIPNTIGGEIFYQYAPAKAFDQITLNVPEEYVANWKANAQFAPFFQRSLDESATAYNVLPRTSADVTMTRSLKAGYNTVVLPFAVSAEKMAAVFGTGTKAYEFVSGAGGQLNFTSVDEMEAHKPYLLTNVPEAKSELSFTGSNAVDLVSGDVNNTINDTYTFTGTYTKIDDIKPTSGSVIYLSGGNFYSKTSAATNATVMKAFRSYLTCTSASLAREFGIFLDGEPTRIVVNTQTGDIIGEGQMYDLQGRRVQAATKGLYIVNGKKFVVK